MTRTPDDFHEIQRFRQVWLWTIVLLGSLQILLITGALTLSNPAMPRADRMVLLIATLPTLAIPVLLLILRMETRVNSQGVHIRFFPFPGRRLPWNSIRRAFMRRYAPLAEYGGWGIRRSSRNGRAWNVAGDEGVQFELTDGRRILIGSGQAARLESAVQARLQPKTSRIQS